VGDNQYRVLGSMLVEDLEDELGVNLGESRAEDTMAGVALSEIGRRARPGDRIAVGPMMLEVLEVERNRIRALKITVTPPTDDEAVAPAAGPSESASSRQGH
jgi:CBS domain containing-hemolysin-like protein